MAIDTDVSVRAGFFCKWMSVERLKEILDTLEDNHLLFPNRVGNLTVVSENYIGYIDFHLEAYKSVEQEICDEQS